MRVFGLLPDYPPAAAPTMAIVGASHGSLSPRLLCGRSSRVLYATTRLSAPQRRYTAFPQIRQIACLRTVLTDRTDTPEDVRFLLTSRAPPQADPVCLLPLARSHVAH